MLTSRSITTAGLLLALLLTVSSTVGAQVAPVQPDSARLHGTPAIPRLVAGGLIGGAVGTLAPLLLVRGCGSPAPPDLECSDLLRDVSVGLGYLVGVPLGVHLAGGRRTSLLRPLLGSLMVSSTLGLIAHGMNPSLAYAIPAVHLVVSVSAVR